MTKDTSEFYEQFLKKINEKLVSGKEASVIIMNQSDYDKWLLYTDTSKSCHFASINETKRCGIRYMGMTLFIHCSLNMDENDDIEIY